MKSSLGIRIILLFMVLLIGSFDRHLSNYFPVEIEAMMQPDAIPAHSDLPVKSGDFHEDITLKDIPHSLPAPPEVAVHVYVVFSSGVPRILPRTAWQPPEYSA